MSKDWGFFFLQVDDAPASIFVDLSLAAAAPITDQLHVAYVSVEMRNPRPDGLSHADEFDTLAALEQALEARLNAGDLATYAGRNTSAGNRDFYFYTADPGALASAVAEAMAAFAPYQYLVGHREDPQWEVYFGFLYPGADDLQRIHNRRVLSVLEEHGDDSGVPRPIDHRAYFPDRGAAELLSAELERQGFAVELFDGDAGEPVTIDFKRIDAPGDIDAVVVPLGRRIRALGGNYDGWGCEVVSPPSS